MSKAGPPKRKEEYVPSDEIKEFRNEILKAGTHLASMSSVGFPDAESVRDAIACVLSIVYCRAIQAGWEVGHLLHKQRRERVYDDQRDSPCEFFCVFSSLINVMCNL